MKALTIWIIILLSVLTLVPTGCKHEGQKTGKKLQKESVSSAPDTKEKKIRTVVKEQREKPMFKKKSSKPEENTAKKEKESQKKEKKVQKSSKKNAKKTYTELEKKINPEDSPSATTLGPKIKFDVMRHSFDTLVQGETYDFKFRFINSGDRELIVEKATATCGCTQPSFPFIGIQPNDSGYIGVHYNSVGKEGFQNPSITVYTNAEPGIYELHLEGQVILPPKEQKDSLK